MAAEADRTEAATPRRRQRARDEGSAVISREIATLASLVAAVVVIMVSGPSLGHAIVTRLAPLLAPALRVDPAQALAQAFVTAGMLAAPIVLAVLSAAAAGTLLQTGFLLSPSAAMPDLARLSPARGLKRLVGSSVLIEAAKSVLKLGLLSLVTVRVLRGGLPALRGAALWQPDQLAGRLMRDAVQVMLAIMAVQTVIAGADYAWQRRQHGQTLRMSKQEVRDETKETDGNPLVKQRLRQLRMARSRKRMMAAVPSATVVLTNPTHYAVALAYDRVKGGAPRIVAKGADEVAARIRQLAQESRVPIVANPPLARALHALPLDTEIPQEHFKLVAEVIAYVWRLQARPPKHWS